METMSQLLLTARRSIVRHTLLSAVFVLLCLLLSHPGVILFSQLGKTAWYPATGLELALLLGVSPWYAVLVCLADAFTGFILYHQPIASLGETVGAIALAVWYGGAAYVLRGPLRVDPGLRRGKDVVRYVAVTMSAALCATLSGVLCLVGDHSVSPNQFWAASVDWFIGDSIGLVTLAPFLLIHVVPSLQRWLSRDDQPQESIEDSRSNFNQRAGWLALEFFGQVASLLVVLWIMLAPRWAHWQLFYLAFIPILWLAMRSGIRLVVIASLAMNFGIVAFTHLFPSNPDLLAKVGLLMLVVSASGLIVGATVSERQYLGIELHKRTTFLNSLFENSPLGIVVLNRKGLVDLVNDSFTKLSLYARNELEGRKLEEVLLSDSIEPQTPWTVRVLDGEHQKKIIRRVRKDGVLIDMELYAVPLIVDGDVQGAYAICKDISEEVKASAAERNHAESLNRLIMELKVQTDQMTLLSQMGTLLECCASTKEAYVVARESVRKFFPEAVSGTLFTFRASRNVVETAVSWGDLRGSDLFFNPQSCWALRRGRPHWCESGGEGIVCPHLAECPPGRHLCLPMVGQGETSGVLHLEFSCSEAEPADLFAARERLGIAVAGQIALSLASLQLRETLRDQSIRDPLTRLFNRRFMQESLEREMIRARRKRHSLSLLVLDIDHFKRFNDTFGHDAGDYVLQSVADLLRDFFRGDDVVCRCGGEEFSVILPESIARDAALRAEELRAKLKGLKVAYKEAHLGPISVSIGISAFPEHCSNTDQLLKIADQCLYQSKREGRDRVTAPTVRHQKAVSTRA
jgi:diguanylate cyclase (GGDEF)-like protein/PAS domain S-box-containing protein